MTEGSATWEHLHHQGHDVWWFHPRRPHPRGHALIYLHDQDSGDLRDRSAFVEMFEAHGLNVAVPITGPTWWLANLAPCFDPRISPLEFVADWVFPLVEARCGARPAVGLLGIGMGGQGALQLAYRKPRRFPVVAAISPAIDFHQLVPEYDVTLTEIFGDREWARQHTATLHIHPLAWPPHQYFCCDPTNYEWFDSSDRLRMKLSSLGVPFECDLETSMDGPATTYENAQARRAVDFIVRGLEREILAVR
ncbi:MAG TPA: alpha/beta hydrolase-fold protein [Pirellulaceae bacterium]